MSPPNANPERVAFCGFLRSLLDGSLSVADWNRFTLTRSQDPELEQARRMIVQHAMNRGQCSARPIPAGIESLAEDWLERLS